MQARIQAMQMQKTGPTLFSAGQNSIGVCTPSHRGWGAPDAIAQTRPKHSASHLQNSEDEHVCPITFEQISHFDSQDIFTSSEGIKYHQPSLKRWLQHEQILPHSHQPLKATELAQLWPEAHAKRVVNIHTLRKYQQREYSYAPFVIAHTLMAYYFFSHIPTPMKRSTHGDTLAMTYLAIFLPISLVILYTNFKVYLLKAETKKIDAIAYSMTDIEQRKADQGVEYYKMTKGLDDFERSHQSHL